MLLQIAHLYCSEHGEQLINHHLHKHTLQSWKDCYIHSKPFHFRLNSCSLLSFCCFWDSKGTPDPKGLKDTLRFILVLYLRVLCNSTHIQTLCRVFVFSHHMCLAGFFKWHWYFIPSFLECFILKFILCLELPIQILQSLLCGFLSPFSSWSSNLGTWLSQLMEHFSLPPVRSPALGSGTCRTS